MIVRKMGTLALTLALSTASLLAGQAGHAQDECQRDRPDGTKGTIGMICTDFKGNAYRWDDEKHVAEYRACVQAVLQDAKADKTDFDLRYYISGYTEVQAINQDLRRSFRGNGVRVVDEDNR